MQRPSVGVYRAMRRVNSEHLGPERGKIRAGERAGDEGRQLDQAKAGQDWLADAGAQFDPFNRAGPITRRDRTSSAPSNTGSTRASTK